jgi:uncharacterized cupin superfamily protein
MIKPIINVADAPTRSDASGERFGYSMTELAGELGARSIGANITRVAPGKAAWPLHHHFANEEHFFVLSGSGVLRLGSETYPVKTNDYIVTLPGGPDHAHQLINTGTQDLVYLAISSRILPEVVGYPDSGKTGVRTCWEDESISIFLLKDSAKSTVQHFWQDEDGARVAAICQGTDK